MQIDAQEAIRQQKALEQLNEQWKQKFAALATDIALRKYCLEQACKLLEERSGSPIEMAEAMHKFITSKYDSPQIATQQDHQPP